MALSAADTWLLEALTWRWHGPTGAKNEYLCFTCDRWFYDVDRHGAEHLQALGPESVKAVHALAAMLYGPRSPWLMTEIASSYHEALRQVLGYPIPPELLLRKP